MGERVSSSEAHKYTFPTVREITPPTEAPRLKLIQGGLGYLALESPPDEPNTDALAA